MRIYDVLNMHTLTHVFIFRCNKYHMTLSQEIIYDNSKYDWIVSSILVHQHKTIKPTFEHEKCLR